MALFIPTEITNPPRRWTACRVIKKPSGRRARQKNKRVRLLPPPPSSTISDTTPRAPSKPREATSANGKWEKFRRQESRRGHERTKSAMLARRARATSWRTRKPAGQFTKILGHLPLNNGVGQRWTGAGELEGGGDFRAQSSKDAEGHQSSKGARDGGKPQRVHETGEVTEVGFIRKKDPPHLRGIGQLLPTSKGVPPIFKGCATIVHERVC